MGWQKDVALNDTIITKNFNDFLKSHDLIINTCHLLTLDIYYKSSGIFLSFPAMSPCKAICVGKGHCESTTKQ